MKSIPANIQGRNPHRRFQIRKLAKWAIVGFAAVFLSLALSADTLGFVEQKFSDLTFERGKWTRTVQLPCYTYTATADGATVDILRIGSGSLVPFKATKGLKVSVCGSTAAFDEGFEAGAPIAGGAARMGRRGPR